MKIRDGHSRRAATERRRAPKIPVLLALGILLAGCDAHPRPATAKATAPKAAAVEAPPQPATQAAGQALYSSPAPADDGHGLAWGSAVAWRDWDSALQTAQAEHKPIALVVYANWCARCKELAPVFQRPDVASAAENLVMVRQDQDAAAPWLAERYADYGRYVPRILFLDPEGQVRDDLQSGHPRFPYFYAPMVADRLIANMRFAAAH